MDLEIPPSEQRDMPRPRRSLAWLWWLVGLVVLGAAAYFGWRWWARTHPPAVAPVAQAPAEAPKVTPPAALSMEEGDAKVRQAGAQLSPAKELSDWLAEKDILRRLVAGVNLVSEGKSPRSVLGFLSPPGEFTVVREQGAVVASPASGARYDTVTRVLTAVDPVALGKAMAELQPYIDSAFREIAPPTQTFNAALHQAIQMLLAVPVPDREPALLPKAILYVYADPGLEGLNGAQKQLLRMGTKNARAVQAWLRRLDGAVGAPATPPTTPVPAAPAEGTHP